MKNFNPQKESCMSEHTTGRTEIVIDLKASREAKGLMDQNQLIQQEALQQFKALLKETYKSIAELKKEEEERERARDGFGAPRISYMRKHDVIMVDGPRGAGKTTFILSLLELIQRQKLFAGEKGDINENLFCLRIVDPTLMDTREHILLSIVSQIRECVEYKLQHKETYYSEGRDSHRDEEQWERSLKELARGICNLEDGRRNSSQSTKEWADPDYFLEQGLKNVEAGFNLEQSFHAFIKNSLKILEHKAFVLALDDIDTDIEKGWPVLEIIRKYLTTPRLIVILMGDMKLYSALIGRKQWEKMGVDPKEEDAQRTYGDLVDNLEDQYSLKVLNSTRRIELRYVDYYALSDQYDIYVRHPDLKERDVEKEKGETLAGIIKSICENIFMLRSPQDIEIYKSVMLDQPARVFVQMLYRYCSITNEKWELTGSPREFISGIGHIFLNPLRKMGFVVAELDRVDEERGMSRLALRLQEHELLEDNAGLTPTYDERWKREAMLTLNAAFSHALSKTPGLLLDFLIKVPLTAAAQEIKISASSESPGQLYVNPVSGRIVPRDILTYSGFVGLHKNAGALEIARRFVAYTRGVPAATSKSRAFFLGTLQLHGESVRKRGASTILQHYYDNIDVSPRAKDVYIEQFWTISREGALPENQIFGRLINTLKTMQNNLRSEQWAVMMMPFSINSASDAEYPFLSIFSLLGAISTLLQTDDTSLRSVVRSMGNVQSYDVGAYRNEEEAWEEYFDDDDGDDEKDGGINLDKFDIFFAERVKKWKEIWINELPQFSVELLMKIWSRFFKTLKSMNREMHAKDAYAGEVLHRCIVAFLNAVLVEVYIEMHGDDDDHLRETNPVTSDDHFYRNLLNVLDGADVSGFGCLFLCPVWGYFLNPGSEVFSFYSKAYKKIDSWGWEVSFAGQRYPNFYPLLNSLAVPRFGEAGEVKASSPVVQRSRNLSTLPGAKMKVDEVVISGIEEDTKAGEYERPYRFIVKAEMDRIVRYCSKGSAKFGKKEFKDIIYNQSKDKIREKIATPLVRAYGVHPYFKKDDEKFELFYSILKQAVSEVEF